MKLGHNLQLEQTQNLIMTPQLQQAIKILQLATIELDQYIQDQIESNPVLEISHDSENKDIDGENRQTDEGIDWKEYTKGLKNSGDAKGVYNKDDDFNYENFIPKDTTLQEHLLFQSHVTFLDERYKKIAEYIIYNLNDNGYLNLSIEEIAEDLSLEYNIVESILKIIQTFDPPGIAARSLKESLLIQLTHMDIRDDNIIKIIEDFLQEIAENKYPYIAKQMGIPTSRVQAISDFIKTLEPKPGRAFAPFNKNYVVADATIKKVGDEYVVILNDRNTPRLIIRDDYRKLISSEKDDGETSKFLNDKLNSAMWLIRSIEQRRQTIYKVIEMILKKQKDFFQYGKKHLKPMTLREVADEIDVHESTVSRATNGKYVETPLGIFELKYFFSSGVERSDGQGISAESIKKYINEIINKEDPYRPLSDDKICQQLTDKGIHISRRTVAKYRDDLCIPSSSKRKRYK